jgi:hypothetical protein
MKDTGLKRVPRGIFALFVFVDANDVSLQIKKNQRGVHSSVVDCISNEKLKPHMHVGLGLILYPQRCFKICALTSIHYNMPPQIIMNCMCQSILFLQSITHVSTLSDFAPHESPFH